MNEVPEHRRMFCDPYCIFNNNWTCVHKDQNKSLKMIGMSGGLFVFVPIPGCGMTKHSIGSIGVLKRFPIVGLARWSPKRARFDFMDYIDLETTIIFHEKPMSILCIYKHMWE